MKHYIEISIQICVVGYYSQYINKDKMLTELLVKLCRQKNSVMSGYSLIERREIMMPINSEKQVFLLGDHNILFPGDNQAPTIS